MHEQQPLEDALVATVRTHFAERFSTPGTIEILKRHFFNDKLWPDFSKIPEKGKATIIYQKVKPDTTADVCGYQVTPVSVNHTVEAAAIIIGLTREILRV